MIKINYTCLITNPPTVFTIVKLARQKTYAIHHEKRLVCIIECNDGKWKRYGSDLLASAILNDLYRYIESLGDKED